MRGFKEVYAEAQRNPGHTGTMGNHVRLVEAAGSDSRKAYKQSGPAVKFGWKGTRGGQQHADERRDYWKSSK